MVLQGDMGEAIEPYIKEDRNVDKVRAAAADACSRLGQFRMPFCWTAIELAKIVRGIPLAMETSDQDSNGSKTNSLERKYSQGGSQVRNIYLLACCRATGDTSIKERYFFGAFCILPDTSFLLWT